MVNCSRNCGLTPAIMPVRQFPLREGLLMLLRRDGPVFGHEPPRFCLSAAGCNPGDNRSGDDRSPAAPRCSRAGRAASTLWEAACDSSRPGRRTGGNNVGPTNAAGHHRPGPNHRPGAAAGGSVAPVAGKPRDLHRVPECPRSGRARVPQSLHGFSCGPFSHAVWPSSLARPLEAKPRDAGVACRLGVKSRNGTRSW
jgi:hypothetical protein